MPNALAILSVAVGACSVVASAFVTYVFWQKRKRNEFPLSCRPFGLIVFLVVILFVIQLCSSFQLMWPDMPCWISCVVNTLGWPSIFCVVNASIWLVWFDDKVARAQERILLDKSLFVKDGPTAMVLTPWPLRYRHLGQRHVVFCITLAVVFCCALVVLVVALGATLRTSAKEHEENPCSGIESVGATLSVSVSVVLMIPMAIGVLGIRTVVDGFYRSRELAFLGIWFLVTSILSAPLIMMKGEVRPILYFLPLELMGYWMVTVCYPLWLAHKYEKPQDRSSSCDREDLLFVLGHPNKTQCFQKQLEKELCSENLALYQTAVEFEDTCTCGTLDDMNVRNQQVMEIYAMYIQEDSPAWVNIPHEQMLKIENTLLRCIEGASNFVKVRHLYRHLYAKTVNAAPVAAHMTMKETVPTDIFSEVKLECVTNMLDCFRRWKIAEPSEFSLVCRDEDLENSLTYKECNTSSD